MKKRVKDSIETYLKLDTGKIIALTSRHPLATGGYGEVHSGLFMEENVPVAVKFMKGGRGNTERSQKERQRFEHEIRMLRKLNRLADRDPNRLGHVSSSHWIIPRQFPHYYGRGVWHGRPFYAMEWLEPFNPLQLKTDFDRCSFAYGLCEAVGWLHSKGYVHCDLKPSNIMCRVRRQDGHSACVGACDYFVVVDYGTIHRKENPLSQNERRSARHRSLSVYRDEGRVLPHTPGYSDPIENRHTIYHDIYSIGQTLRDMFEGEVPPEWARIILRCTCLWWKGRYQSVEELVREIAAMDAYRLELYQSLHDDYYKSEGEKEQLIHEGAKSGFTPKAWKDLLKKNRKSRGRDKAWYWTVDEDERIMALTGYAFKIDEPLRLPENVVLTISGKLMLSATITGEKGSAVVLKGGAVLHNCADQKMDQAAYFVTERAYLNFVRCDPSEIGLCAAVKTRVFQSYRDVTHVGFHGFATVRSLQNADAKRFAEIPLPTDFKQQVGFFRQKD